MVQHLIRMPPGRIPLDVFQARHIKRPRGRPRARWRDCVSSLTLEHLSMEELESAAEERHI